MFKLLKLVIAAWIIFVFIAVANDGGNTIRSLESDTQKMVSKTLNIVADKADSLKEQADSAKEKIKSLKGVKKEIAQTEPATPMEKKTKIR